MRLWFIPILACWPVWRWLAERMGSDHSELVGLLPPLLAAALGARRSLAVLGARRSLAVVQPGERRSVGAHNLAEGDSAPSPSPSTPPAFPWPLALPIALLFFYALSYGLLLPLPRAMLAMTVLAATISALWLGGRLHLALWGLLLLGLPVIPSLQFYLGYPLRALVAQVAAPLLRGAGFHVLPAGACLRWGSDLIAIDAPCSGVKMLWAGGVLVIALALAWRLSAGRTVQAILGALVLLLVGNAVRAAALFFPETGVVALPGWTHEAVGMIVFLGVAAGIVWWVSRLAPSRPEPPVRVPRISRRSSYGFALAGLLAAAVPLLHPTPSHRPLPPFPGWPTQFEGRPLSALPLTARERRFQEEFPGKIGRFTDGRRELVIRWVVQDTRRLHPAADCFRGAGYRVTPLPLVRDQQGHWWGASRVVRAGRAWCARERLYDEGGHSWSDVSAWYWSAALRRTAGPWWAVTVVEAAMQDDANSR
jgi:exosortase/archaeosortase family protein